MQHLKFPWCKLDFFAVAHKGARDGIEPAIAEFINFRLLFTSASHKRFGPGQELFYTERLRNYLKTLNFADKPSVDLT